MATSPHESEARRKRQKCSRNAEKSCDPENEGDIIAFLTKIYDDSVECDPEHVPLVPPSQWGIPCFTLDLEKMSVQTHLLLIVTPILAHLEDRKYGCVFLNVMDREHLVMVAWKQAAALGSGLPSTFTTNFRFAP